jgi:hypothetical protein
MTAWNASEQAAEEVQYACEDDANGCCNEYARSAKEERETESVDVNQRAWTGE